MKNFITLFVVSASLVLMSHNTLNFAPQKVRKIVIDAGHGGKDPGCLGKHTQEKDVAFEMATELGGLLKAYLKDVEIVYTRKGRHDFVELRERARLANKELADLFISLHCNASESGAVHGTETYIMGLTSADDNLDVAIRENASILKEYNYEAKYDGFDPNSPISYIMMSNYQNAYQAHSLKLAHNIEGQFSKSRNSRGVKQSGFVVLWKTAMPSVLIESGFLTNEKEEAYLTRERGRSETVSGILRAVRNYKAEIEGRK